MSPLAVDLDDGSPWQGFLGMLRLGVAHIADGTDHHLFLLTLLLPAPPLAVGRRWRQPAPVGTAVRRITAIALAFTIGHSGTLALGTLGLPVPQQPVQVLIAVSILVAAAHALRPLFLGREPVVAAVFGLVHGMAFSTTLSSLDLSESQLALSLLGFNLGIELMQLAVVLVVLPPDARPRPHVRLPTAARPCRRPHRCGSARVAARPRRLTTPLGAAADALGPASPWIVACLWLAALYTLVEARGMPAKSPRLATGELPLPRPGVRDPVDTRS